MRVRFNCPNETCQAVIDSGPLPSGDTEVVCPRCQSPHAVRAGVALAAGRIDRCPRCDGDELFVRKDFPQKAGLVVVVIVAVLSVCLFAAGRLVPSIGVLVALTIIDLVIYPFIPRLTVCYRCRAEYRGIPVNPAHRGFDLATSEKYEVPRPSP